MSKEGARAEPAEVRSLQRGMRAGELHRQRAWFFGRPGQLEHISPGATRRKDGGAGRGKLWRLLAGGNAEEEKSLFGVAC